MNLFLGSPQRPGSLEQIHLMPKTRQAGDAELPASPKPLEECTCMHTYINMYVSIYIDTSVYMYICLYAYLYVDVDVDVDKYG